MKKSAWLGLFTLLALAVTFSLRLSGAEKDKTFTGTLVDSKCYLMNHELTGNDHGTVKQCGTLCLKGGTPGGLLTKDKKFYALLAPSLVLAPYVGQEVRVTGSIVSGAINLSKAEVKENGSWQEIKLGAMM
jgi:hypothetical protein